MTLDHHFPRFHVRPPTGFINDPNGPVVVDGRVHLYFQYRPVTRRDCPVFWGHATSTDFLHWQHHRPAIAPDPSGPDWGGVWSGNTVVLGDRVRAFYSAYVPGHPYQSVVAADSLDGGFSYGPPRRMVADPEAGEGILTFRDPFVWRSGDGWRMVVGSGNNTGVAAARSYSSTDLETWTFEGNLAELERVTLEGGGLDTGDMWECPQVIDIGDMTLLFVSCWSRTDGTTRVMSIVGSADNPPMRSPAFALYDHGTNFYAASALREGTQGPLLWGWATEGRSDDWAAECDWSGMLTLPRRISLAGTDTVRSDPIDGMSSMRGTLLSDERGSQSQVTVGAQFEVCARPSRRDAQTRYRIRFSALEHLDILVDGATREVTIDRSAASRDPRADGGTAIVRPPENSEDPLGIRAFFDGSILELFTSDGVCATVRFYPLEPPPWTVEVSGATEGDEFAVWELRPTILRLAAEGEESAGPGQ